MPAKIGLGAARVAEIVEACKAAIKGSDHKASADQKKIRWLTATGRLSRIVFLFSEVIVHAGSYQSEPVAV